MFLFSKLQYLNRFYLFIFNYVVTSLICIKYFIACILLCGHYPCFASIGQYWPYIDLQAFSFVLLETKFLLIKLLLNMKCILIVFAIVSLISVSFVCVFYFSTRYLKSCTCSMLFPSNFIFSSSLSSSTAITFLFPCFSSL